MSKKHVGKPYLDTLWRKKIYGKWKGRCCRCGGTVGLQAAHIFRRALMSTRWNTNNGLLMCTGPGSKNDHYWFDNLATPKEHREFVVGKIGEEAMGKLEATASKMWDKDWERVLRELKDG